jgi:acyl carrier protein
MTLEDELKQLIIEGLNLDSETAQQLETDTALFGEGLGLDSLDAVELVVALQRKYGELIEGLETERDSLQSIKTLAEFIRERRESKK